MTGIGCAAAGNAPTVSAPAPLAATVTWSGSTPVTVTGSSGLVASDSNGGTFHPNVISHSATGGTPPYSTNLYLTNSPSGKLSIGSADGLHETIGYTGFAVNEIQSTDLQYDVTDSLGATASASYAGVIIKRTS